MNLTKIKLFNVWTSLTKGYVITANNGTDYGNLEQAISSTFLGKIYHTKDIHHGLISSFRVGDIFENLTHYSNKVYSVSFHTVQVESEGISPPSSVLEKVD